MSKLDKMNFRSFVSYIGIIEGRIGKSSHFGPFSVFRIDFPTSVLSSFTTTTPLSAESVTMALAQQPTMGFLSSVRAQIL